MPPAGDQPVGKLLAALARRPQHRDGLMGRAGPLARGCGYHGAAVTKIGLHWWIVLGIVAGAILGTALNRAYLGEAEREVVGAGATTADLQAHADQINQALERRVEATAVGAALDGVRRIFLNLLKLIVIPLVFFSLVSGIAGMGEASRLGRVGLKTAVWYISTSLLAILTGLVFVNLIGPGFSAAIAIPTAPIEAHAPGSFWDVHGRHGARQRRRRGFPLRHVRDDLLLPPLRDLPAAGRGARAGGDGRLHRRRDAR